MIQKSTKMGLFGRTFTQFNTLKHDSHSNVKGWDSLNRKVTCFTLFGQYLTCGLRTGKQRWANGSIFTDTHALTSATASEP